MEKTCIFHEKVVEWICFRRRGGEEMGCSVEYVKRKNIIFDVKPKMRIGLVYRNSDIWSKSLDQLTLVHRKNAGTVMDILSRILETKGTEHC